MQIYMDIPSGFNLRLAISCAYIFASLSYSIPYTLFDEVNNLVAIITIVLREQPYF